MADSLDSIPPPLQAHLRQVALSAGLPDCEETYETLARAWLEKKAGFEERVRHFAMEEVDRIEADDERGFLVMTYSGSLLKVGPLVEGARRVEYTSIGLRTNVPDAARAAGSGLDGGVSTGGVVNLRHGPICSTSPVFKIAVFASPLGVAEQERRLSLLTDNLAREFARSNSALSLKPGGR
jgi:hypothetical protein